MIKCFFKNLNFITSVITYIFEINYVKVTITVRMCPILLILDKNNALTMCRKKNIMITLSEQEIKRTMSIPHYEMLHHKSVQP